MNHANDLDRQLSLTSPSGFNMLMSAKNGLCVRHGHSVPVTTDCFFLQVHKALVSNNKTFSQIQNYIPTIFQKNVSNSFKKNHHTLFYGRSTDGYADHAVQTLVRSWNSVVKSHLTYSFLKTSNLGHILTWNWSILMKNGSLSIYQPIKINRISKNTYFRVE